MDIQKLAVESIDVGERLRPLDDAWVKFIAGLVAEVGLHMPIEVRSGESGRFCLVTGAHRFEAVRRCELTTIDAIVLPAMSEDEARLAEIRENLYRHELSALDQAVFLAETKRLYEKLNPHSQNGRYDRQNKGLSGTDKNLHLAPSFAEVVAGPLFLTPRHVRHVLKRAEIEPEVRALIAGTHLARTGSELDELVKLAPEHRCAAVQLVLSKEPDAPKTIRAARTIVTGRQTAKLKRSRSEEQSEKISKGWHRLDADDRERFIRELYEKRDPALMRLFERRLREMVAAGDDRLLGTGILTRIQELLGRDV